MSVTERRAGDRRHEPRTMEGPPADPPQGGMRTNPRDDVSMRDHPPVRDNPEVMGRTEPQTVAATPRTMEPKRSAMWPDMSEYRQRFEEIQSEFIDDPKAAVQKAERLIQEAIDRMTKSMHERMQSMHHDGGKDDTEQLRVTMRSYREFIQSLGGSRAA